MQDIAARLDTPVSSGRGRALRDRLTAAGFGGSIVDFLEQLYEAADGGTFWNGAFRVLPVDGDPAHDLPDLATWNAPDDWKQYAPQKASSALFFCANAFGDQFGVPITADREIARDRVAVLWVERYVYEESSIAWAEIFRKLLDDQDSMATYLARLKEYEWAVHTLGAPARGESCSWNLPPVLGGAEDIDNLQIVPLAVNVSFTLQVIMESKVGP